MAETFLTRKIYLPPLNFSTEQIVILLCANGPNRYKASKPKFVFYFGKKGGTTIPILVPFIGTGIFCFSLKTVLL
jgi:hypothetical protein